MMVYFFECIVRFEEGQSFAKKTNDNIPLYVKYYLLENVKKLLTTIIIKLYTHVDHHV